MNNKYIKPPIGVLNRKVYETFLNEDIIMNGGMCLTEVKKQRLDDLQGAITRYAEAKLNIDLDWITEYNELLSEFGIKKINFIR